MRIMIVPPAPDPSRNPAATRRTARPVARKSSDSTCSTGAWASDTTISATLSGVTRAAASKQYRAMLNRAGGNSPV
jgi:hypothetical protein